jgi:uncharacterized protein YaaQ
MQALSQINPDPPPIQRLILAVVQTQDMLRASRALSQAGMYVVELASSGGFLGRRNTTLLVGLKQDQEALALSLIQENCHQRVEYISTPLEGAPLPVPVATPITVGGAIVFTLTVERFEEF